MRDLGRLMGWARANHEEVDHTIKELLRDRRTFAAERQGIILGHWADVIDLIARAEDSSEPNGTAG